MKVVPFGKNFLVISENPSKLFVKNKLSSKPQSVVKDLGQFVEKQDNYHVTMQQDYSKNMVNLNLVSKGYYINRNPKFADRFDDDHIIYQTRSIPATSAVKTYKKVVQNMIEAQTQENLNPTPEVKKSLFERIFGKN